MEEATFFRSIYPEEIYQFSPPVTVVIGAPFGDILEEHRQLLNKILQAVRHSTDSVRILHQPRFDLSNWAEKPSRLLAFVPPPNGLTTYEVIQTQGMSVVFSDPLEMLMNEDASKRKLWNALKALFPA